MINARASVRECHQSAGTSVVRMNRVQATMSARFSMTTGIAWLFLAVLRNGRIGCRRSSGDLVRATGDARSPQPNGGSALLFVLLTSDHQSFGCHSRRLARARRLELCSARIREVSRNLALAHVESRRERRRLWLLIDLAAGLAITALLWVVTNTTSAIVFACLWAVLIVGGFLSARSRNRRTHSSAL
jgi:hypothetical protein